MKEIGETSAGKEVGRSVECAGKYAARRAEGSAYAVLTAPQSKFIRVSPEQRIRCCLSRFFYLFTFYVTTPHLPSRGSARSL